MSTSINFVTKHINILFIAEVRGDGGNMTGYNSTSTESYTAKIVIVMSVVMSVVFLVSIVCLAVVFYTSKEIFFTTF
jgi:hypothetical protein